jgi:cytochrome c biogenesis protein CcmG/thiol:disulfide interchange protein DsbE
VPGFAAADLAQGRVSIVNVWASWCAPCHAEHPHLVTLAERSKAPLYGINYKDRPEEARRFLGRYGNPFVAVGADASGRTAIDWGVYGVPETFIIDGRGRIAHKHVGPITPEVIEQRLLPAIEKAAR